MKLTNGFMVIRPGEEAGALPSPGGYSWSISNQTSRPVRLRVGTTVELGGDEWRVCAESGRAVLSWIGPSQLAAACT